MDQVVLVDEQDNIIGQTSINEAHKKGLLHRVSVIYLKNDSGQILVQHRSKEYGGRLDHSSAGHVDPGESYLDTAKRELKEELGVENIPLEEIGKDNSEENKPGGNHVRHQYTIYKCKANPGEINKEEVQQIFWADPEEIIRDMKNDPKNVKYTTGFKVTIKDIIKTL